MPNPKTEEPLSSFIHVFTALTDRGPVILSREGRKASKFKAEAAIYNELPAIHIHPQTRKSVRQTIFAADWKETFNYGGSQINVFVRRLSEEFPEHTVKILLEIAMSHDWDPQDIQDVIFNILSEQSGKGRLKGLHPYDAQLKEE